MTESQERRYVILYAEARAFWEQRYAALAGGDFPWDKGADIDCQRWWARFGEGLPIPACWVTPNVK
jgi:hypothetical protein